MTKKDYILIAGEIKRGEMLGNAFETKKQIALRLASALQAENPRFNRSKFLEACGIESEGGKVGIIKNGRLYVLDCCPHIMNSQKPKN